MYILKKLLKYGPSSPLVLSVEDEGGSAGDGAGGGGEPPPERTFSQAEVNNLMKRERTAAETKYAGHAALVEERATLAEKVVALEQEQELANANAAEKAEILAQRAAEQNQTKVEGLTTKIAALETERKQADERLVDFRKRTLMSEALATAGVLATASKHALSAMMSDYEVTMGESGDLVSVKLDGVPQDDMAAAAVQFLSDNAHFKSAPAGGSGTSPQSGGGVGDPAVGDMTPEQLWNASRRT